MTAIVTLSLYIVRQFAMAVGGMLLALAGLVSMFDFIELLRRSASLPDATFGIPPVLRPPGSKVEPAAAPRRRPRPDRGRCTRLSRPRTHQERTREN